MSARPVGSSSLSLQGHEVVGTVFAAHPSVKKFEIGQKVIAPFTINCGACFYCEGGYSSRCVKSLLFGSERLDGAQAEYVRVPLADSTLIAAPEDLADEVRRPLRQLWPTSSSHALHFTLPALLLHGRHHADRSHASLRSSLVR